MVTVNVSPEKKDEFLAIMAADAVGTRNEAENLRFDLLADEQDSSKFYLYSVYKSKQGLDAHRKTPHYKAWTSLSRMPPPLPWVRLPSHPAVNCKADPTASTRTLSMA